MAEAWVGAGALPGAQYRVIENGQLLADVRLGFRDIEQKLPVENQSLYRLASASKIFVSVGLLRLVEKSDLSLLDQVSSIFPEYAELRTFDANGKAKSASNGMTVIDLLRHTCGYGYGDQQTQEYRQALIDAGLLGVDQLGFDHWLHDLSLREWARALAQVPMTEEPGTKVRYGLGHDLAGAVIESLSGLPLDKFMRQEVFDPLGLRDTYFVVPGSRATDLTAFYYRHKGELELIETAAESEFLKRPTAFSGGGGWDMLGNGGLVGSAQDLTTLLQMIVDGGIHQGQAYLSPEHADLLCLSQSNQLPGNEMLPGCEYSLGAGVVTDPDLYQTKGTGSSGPRGKVWWGGSTNTYFFYVPDTKRLGVFMSNILPFGYKGAVFKFGQLSQK